MGRPEKPVDPGAGPVQRFAYELRKLREEAGRPTYRAMAARAGYALPTLAQAAAGERLPSLSVTLAYVGACGGDPEEWEERWREAARAQEALAAPPDDDGAPAPYQGLARFEPSDHERFFGRERLTDEVWDVVREHRCAVLVGPSGSGKSSLLRAGLVPRLRRAEDLSLRPAAVRLLTPGEHPLRGRREVFAPAPGDGDTWLLVDQFEEVHTLCRDPEERAEFVRLLLAADDPASRLRVLIAVRADFYGRCLEHPELVAVARRASVPVGPMTPAELRDAVVRPAAAQGLIVERALTARLVEEVAGEPGGLPLMSHALLETWRRRRGRMLTAAAYEAAGGLRGAIAQSAEDLYVGLPPAQARVARRILLRLITPGQGAPDTRCPVARSALEGTGADREETGPVLERLARARLVVLDDDMVDLTHEALITAWPRLRGWLDESRQRLLLHRRLSQAAQAWDELHRDPASLYRGGRLAEAEAVFGADPDGELTALEAEFLGASRRAAARERRRRRGLLSALAALVVLSLVAGVTAWREREAGDRRQEEATSRRLASLARNLASSDPRTARRLGLAAWRVSPTTEARAALAGAAAQREEDMFVWGREGQSDPMVLSADGSTLAAAGERSVTVAEAHAAGRSATLPLTDALTLLDLSPDGRRLLMGTPDSRFRVYDVATRKPLGPPFGRVDGTAGGFRPGGRLVGLYHGDAVELWDARDGRRVFRRPTTMEHPVTEGAGSDRLLAVCVRPGTLEIWDVYGRRTVRSLPAAAQRTACRGGSGALLSSVLIDGSGRRLVVVDEEGARSWDLASGRELPRIRHAGLRAAAVSVDGALLAAADETDILLWRLSDPGRPVFRHPSNAPGVSQLRLDVRRGTVRYLAGIRGGAVHTLRLGDAAGGPWGRERTRAAAFSPDGALLATMARSGSTIRFRLRSTRPGGRVVDFPPLRCLGDPNTDADWDEACHGLMAFSPDGARFAYGISTWDTEGDLPAATPLAVWDTRRHVQVVSFQAGDGVHGNPGGAAALAFTPDGSLLTYGSGTLEVWDAATGRRVGRLPNAEPEVAGSESMDGAPAGTLVVRPDGGFAATAYGVHFAIRSVREPSLRSAPLRRALGQEQPTVVAYGPDGKRLAVGETSGLVGVWDGSATRRLAVLPAAGSGGADEELTAVTALAFSPDGSVLATGDRSGAVRLWDTASGLPLGGPLPTAGDTVRALAFDEGGARLLVAGERAPLRTYPVGPERLAAVVCRRGGGGLSPAEWRAYVPELPYREQC
ncbi:hypothetical protein ACFPM3_07495 [Streptomyces coeruleoprunus]|uniref:HTH cro/C1-type domain-containing protein n=1 Tax=Streptomyces coeruleoprunus TaxID=285563 RepID=A0ABV9XB72_9ACTN